MTDPTYRCAHVDPDEGACILRAGHEEDHFLSFAYFPEPFIPAALAEAHTVTPTDQFAYTRNVEVIFDRGAGPLLYQPIHDARVTLVRLVYRYEPTAGWITEIGPVHGHVIIQHSN